MSGGTSVEKGSKMSMTFISYVLVNFQKVSVQLPTSKSMKIKREGFKSKNL